MEIHELTKMVNELWYYHQSEIIESYILIPLGILELIAIYKINQVLKIYIYENNKFLK